MKHASSDILRVDEDKNLHPARMLCVIVGGVAGAEAVFELMLYWRPAMSPYIEAILDGSFVMAVALPLVYLSVYRPMRLLIDHYRSAIEEVRTLRGIITICSVCKNIRTSAETWERIETYVRARSEAEFSHGLCPDCVRKLYPEDAEWVNEQIRIHRPLVQDTGEIGSGRDL